MPWWVTLIIVAVVVAAVALGLYFWGKRNQKKMDEQQAQIDATKQTFSMLVIDKKKLKIKDAGLPQMVVDQVPFYMRWRKFPVVKGKVGPRIMTFMCETKVYDQIPVKAEIKATVSGLYIVEVRGIRTALVSKKKKKKNDSKLDTLLKKGRGEI